MGGDFGVYALLLNLFNLKVVVHEGVIREKPSNKDEARLFIKGLFIGLPVFH